jgi:ribosomal-protein-alanine N-acetyltransferase
MGTRRQRHFGEIMTEIQTQRLRLIALTMEQLGLYITNPVRLERQLGLSLSRAVLTEPAHRAIGIKLSKMSQVTPRHHPWYTYWLVVISEEEFGAGLVGFKGYPNPDGEVEIGYGIDPSYQSRGYTTEVVRALIVWAFEHPICQAVLADTQKSNLASQRVLEKAGFHLHDVIGDTLYWRVNCEVASQ